MFSVGVVIGQGSTSYSHIILRKLPTEPLILNYTKRRSYVINSPKRGTSSNSTRRHYVDGKVAGGKIVMSGGNLAGHKT